MLRPYINLRIRVSGARIRRIHATTHLSKTIHENEKGLGSRQAPTKSRMQILGGGLLYRAALGDERAV